MDWLRDEEEPVRQPTMNRALDPGNQNVGVNKRTSLCASRITNTKMAESWVE